MVLHQNMHLVFKLLKFTLCTFDRNIAKVMCSLRIILEDTCPFVPFLVMTTSVTGFGWISPM